MDPFIESPEIWRDFHHNLASQIQRRLNPLLQPRYYAAVEASNTLELVEAQVPMEDPVKVLTVEIRSASDDLLVASIELLSPVNKKTSHEAFDAYARKRRALLHSAAHLMEIDLLRGGQRPPLLGAVPEAHYYLTLPRRAASGGRDLAPHHP